MLQLEPRPALRLLPFALAALGACGEMAIPSAPVAPTEPQFAAQPLKRIWTVTTLDDPGSGSCTSSYCSLRQAVAAAQPGDRVVFKGTVKGTIALTGSIQITKALQVDGGGRITLDAQGNDIVLSTLGDNIDVSGFTLTGGTLGAINVLGGTLTLRSSTVTGNTSVFGGGGIRNLGTLTVINSSITNNTTPTDGAGIWSNGGAVTVVRSTISGNDAGGYGGGIWVTSTGAASVQSSTITRNSAGRVGGGIYNYGAVLAIRSSAVVETVSPGAGAGVGVESLAEDPGIILFANSIIAGNNAGDCYNGTPTQGEIKSTGYTLSSTGTTGCFFLYPTGVAPTDVFIDPAQLYTDVLDVELRNNGGPTMTHALIERGRAVDAGSCPGELTDQRGLTRPFDDSRIPNAWDGCDIGPVEWLPPATGGRKK